MSIVLPNYSELTKEDGKIHGSSNVLNTVNPFNTYFIATYPDGSVVKGNNLINTGWDEIPNGLSKLEFFLSTGHLIEIPLYRAYRPLIECSIGLDNSRVFHCINVQCLTENSIVVDKIILKEGRDSKFKIGDRVLSRINELPKEFNKSWKFTSS